MNYYKKLNNFNNIKFSIQLKPYIFKMKSSFGLNIIYTYKYLFFYKNNLCLNIPGNKLLIKTIFNRFYNNFRGLQQLYVINLIIKGLGFKAIIIQNYIIFKLGFSHLIMYKIPKYLKIKISQKFSKIELFSINLQKLKIFCILIQNLKFPEVYKGKGIIYKNNIIILKSVKNI
jgi:ribosomal protein L6P/L9E